MTHEEAPFSCSCGRIDVHSHFLPPAYRKALRDEGIVKVDGGIPVPEWSVEGHLAMMARVGIGASLLSISSPGLHFLDAAKASRVARQVNEEAAEIVRDYPGQFGAFATLPLQDPAASVDEVAYALDVLKLDGVALETNSRGLYLGDSRFSPLFDELERREAVVFMHPTSPACLGEIGMGYPGPLLEFPFDTARSVLSLVYNGVLRKRPEIRLILSHAGGALPSLLTRMATISDFKAISPRPERGAAEVIEEVRRMYFDLALAASPLNFNALLEITDISHILFGTDHPFAPDAVIDANSDNFQKLMDNIPSEQREMVEYGNALNLVPRLKKAR